MTVISALIAKHGTAHASDSFKAKVERNGGIEVINSQQTKLVYVKHWRGVLAYWDWLNSRSGQHWNGSGSGPELPENSTILRSLPTR